MADVEAASAADGAGSDASCSSVDQFLRDNGFGLGALAGGLSGGELDEEALTPSDLGVDGDAARFAAKVEMEEGGEAASGSGSGSLASGVSLSGLSGSHDDSSGSPRFVLLGDDDLLLVDEAHGLGPSEAGSSTGERDAPQARQTTQPPSRTEREAAPDSESRVVDDSLDRSMLLGRSVVSGSSFGSFLDPHSLDGADAFERHVGDTLSNKSEGRESADLDTTSEFGAATPTPTTPDDRLPPVYQMTPQAVVASASSSSSLSSGVGRPQDLELSHALGVQTPTPAPASAQAETTSGQPGTDRLANERRSEPPISHQSSTRHSLTDETNDGRPPRLQRALFSSSVLSSQSDGNSIGAHDQWDRYLSASVQQLSPNTSSGVSGASGFAATIDMPPVTPPRRDSKRRDEWRGLNDLLRKNALPAIRFRDDGRSADSGVPDPDSLLELVQDFVVQLDRKNEVRCGRCSRRFLYPMDVI